MIILNILMTIQNLRKLKMNDMICTSECVNCIYGTLDASDKAKAKIICSNKEKEYYYGQIINCENFRRANEER